MMKFDYRQRLLGTTLLVGASLIATPASAQTQPAPGTDTGGSNVSNPTGPAEAQPTPTTSATGKTVESGQDVVVTGTRIPQPNLESTAPVTVVTNQDIKLQGVTKVEDLLNSLPSVFAAQSSTLANGATGTATVDLRGLGSTRTLVLVNGRRLTPGDPGSSTADLNFIPSSIVKRVEVLTGGASSTYGADAVAGVVNFIMDTNFTGIRFDGQYSLFQHNNGSKVTPPLLDARARTLPGYQYPKGSVADGGTFDGTVSIGTGFDDNRGHALAYFGYRKANPVLQSRRDYSACTIQNTGAALTSPRRLNPAAPLQCGGSLTSYPGTAIYFPSTTSSSTVGTFGPGTLNRGATTRYNFAPTNYFQRPDERYTAGVFANYEIAPAVKPYLEFMFMDDRTVAQIAPSGDFGNTLTINCDNPLLSANQRSQLCNSGNLITGFLGNFPLVPGTNTITPGAAPINFINPVVGALNPTYNQAFLQLLRRNVEGGPRRSDLQHTSFRGVLGTRGDLSKAWSYDAYFQYGRTNYSQVYSNEFSASRLRNALDAVTNPANGQVVCRSVLTGADPNCAPYDIFTGAGPSTAALNYLTATGFQKGATSEQVASVNFTGLLGEYGLRSPWAETGIGVNVGAEYRNESVYLNTDNAFQTGDLTGQGAPTLPISGNFHVTEFFGEANVPIVEKGFFYDLSLNGGYRRSSYKTSSNRTFKTNTYKLGVEFAPIRDVRFRAAYNRAVRAPNLQELFAAQFVGLDGTSDPCTGGPIAATNYGCLAQGLRVGQTVTANPAAQYNGLLGGNPNLNPERATTKTLGVVLQPRFLPRAALTVDYFNIKVKNAIQGYGADAILAACSANTTATTVSPVCSLIQRNPVNGSLWLTPDGFVRDLPTNVGGVKTSGIEVNGSYSQPIGRLGTLSASLVGTYTKDFIVDNGLTQAYDCAGFYGPTCGSPRPDWRHKARLSWTMRNGIGISAQWRYFGAVDIEYKNSSSTLNGNFYNFNSRIGAQSYFDLALSANVQRGYNLRLGVNNFLDKDPPLVTSGSGTFGASACASVVCNGNTYPGTYDALGRYLYAGVTIDF